MSEQSDTYDAELEDARRMDREHPDPDMSVGYEEALQICRLEAEQCTCLWDEVGGRPIPDGCLWHDRAAQDAAEQEMLGEMVARRPAPAAGRTGE